MQTLCSPTHFFSSCPRGDSYGSGNSSPSGKSGSWGPLLTAEFYNSQKEFNLWVPAMSVQPDFCSATHFHPRHDG